jgi:hypothetical protein
MKILRDGTIGFKSGRFDLVNDDIFIVKNGIDNPTRVIALHFV